MRTIMGLVVGISDRRLARQRTVLLPRAAGTRL